MDDQTESDDIYDDLENCYQRIVALGKTPSDGESSTHTETPSDPWCDDQDFSTINPNVNEVLSSRRIPSSSTKEYELKENEIDLFSDLIAIEEEDKRAKQNHDAEFEDLKKELQRLKDAEASNKAKISKLLTENINLKKNICSLYKTSKSEIEHKNSLLADANRKLDNFLFRKNAQNFQPDRFERNPNFDDRRNHSDRRTDDDRQSADRRGSKKIRYDFPSISYHSQNERESEERRSKLSKTHETTPQRPSSNSTVANITPSQAASSRSYSLYTPETVGNSSSLSRDATETNNLFFNLLPESLKQSFFEYEQSQIVTLNRLKQSFINQHFNCDSSIQTPSAVGTPPQLTAPFKHIMFNRDLHNTPVNTASLLMPSTRYRNHNGNSRHLRAGAITQSGKKFVKPNVKIDSQKLTKNMQIDIASLHLYTKERIPFLDKRKFGLDKNGKEIVPECVL